MSGSRPTKEQLKELDALRRQEWEAVRTAALESTWTMAQQVLWPDTAERHYYEAAHRPLCDWLDFTPPGGKRAAIFHRQARKTMLLNVARAVRLVCKYPDIRIMIVSALQRTAIDMCGLIKRQFTANKSFAHFFPEFAINDGKWGKIDEFTVPWRTSTSLLDPTLFATYLGSPVISRRCDYLCFDDPVDEGDVNNPDMAMKTMANFTKFIPVVDDTSTFRQTTFIGTFKSYNDPASAICGGKADTVVTDEDKRAVGDWEVVFRPISYVPTGDFYRPGDFAFPDENPKAIVHLPNVHDAERIRGIFKQCLDDKDKGESYFYREYACLVQAPGDQKFQASWLDTWIDPSQVPPNTIFSAIAVDSAIKDEQILFKGDNTVILVGHHDALGNLYLTDGARSRSWRMDDFRRVLLAMAQVPHNRGPQNFLREKVGEGTIFPTIRQWFNSIRRPIVTHALRVVGQGKKYLRIMEALQAPAMGRKILFVRGQFPAELHKVLVDELIHLGQWGHDDVADAISLFYHPEVRPVIETFTKKVVWKDVVSRPSQISTAWNNTAALAHAAPQVKVQDPRVARLTPAGQELTFVTGDFTAQPESTAVENEAWWEKL